MDYLSMLLESARVLQGFGPHFKNELIMSSVEGQKAFYRACLPSETVAPFLGANPSLFFILWVI
jgi:hypothetical protein